MILLSAYSRNIVVISKLDRFGSVFSATYRGQPVAVKEVAAKLDPKLMVIIALLAFPCTDVINYDVCFSRDRLSMKWTLCIRYLIQTLSVWWVAVRKGA